MLQRIDRWLRRNSFDYMLWREYAQLVRSIDADKPSLVVFQMGKVGSSTVTATLMEGMPSHNVFQVHFLAEEWVEKVIGQYREASRHQSKPFIDRHVLLSRYLSRVLREEQKPRHQWQLISLVREPVARNLSSFFQSFPVYFSSRASTADAEAVTRYSPAELGRMFVNEFGEYRHKVPSVWFQTHVQPLFGLDVYAEPFDHARGYQIVENEKARMLVLRAEDVDRVFLGAFEAFQQVRLPKLIRKNDGADKAYASTYRETRQLVEVPQDYVDRLYGSTYMQHFYTAEEIEKFRSGWQRASDTNAFV